MIKRRKNMYILFSVIFLVFGIGFSFISYINISRYNNLGNVVNERKAELSVLQEREAYLKKISANYEEVMESLLILEDKIGKSLSIEDVYRDLESIYTLGDVESTSVGNSVDKGDYVELPVSIKLTTDMESIRRLFYSLKYTGRCFRVNDFSFETDVTGHLSTTLNLTVFSMKQ